MVIPPFKKTKRLGTSLVYGIIAFDVVNIVWSVIEKSSDADIITRVIYDPSGLLKLLIRICQVLLSALKNYPQLVAFCADSLIIYIGSTFGLIAEIAINIYTDGNFIKFKF